MTIPSQQFIPDKDIATSSPYYSLWILFSRVHNILVKVRNQELKQYGINLEYLLTLSAIRFLGKKATPSAIARQRYRRPHTISVVLANMEKEGLVTRNKDLDRKNMVRIALTRKGEGIRLKAKRTELIRNILLCLSREERERLSMFLDTLLRKATYKYAISYKTKPAHELYRNGELEYDLGRILRRTKNILSEISESLQNAKKGGVTTGIEALDKIDTVRTALTEKCFSPEELERLSEYLEMLRSQATSRPKTNQEGAQAESFSDGEMEHGLWRTFQRAYDTILRIRDKELAKFGLSVKSASVLLWTKTLGDKATPFEIAKHRLRSLQSVYTAMTRLERKGLIKKTRDPSKRNQSRPVLTEKGEEFLQGSAQSESVYQIFACLSPEELEHFYRYLVSIYERATEIYQDMTPNS